LAVPKSQKIKSRRVFRNLSSLHQLAKTDNFRLLAKKRSIPKLTGYPQIALIISKKQLKSAVRRNRARRKVEEAYRTSQPLIPDNLIQRFQYLVFLLNANAQEANFLELQRQIINAIIKD